MTMAIMATYTYVIKQCNVDSSSSLMPKARLISILDHCLPSAYAHLHVQFVQLLNVIFCSLRKAFQYSISSHMGHPYLLLLPIIALVPITSACFILWVQLWWRNSSSLYSIVKILMYLSLLQTYLRLHSWAKNSITNIIVLYFICCV